MVRSNPGKMNRMSEFLEKGIIAVHWGIGDLTGCVAKEEVAKVVAKANLKPRDANLKTGLLHRFVNKMKVDDYCIVPYNDVFYTAVIKSDYYFDSNSQKFEHQRKVEWLFDGEPFERTELPKKIQASLKSQLGLADISQHEAIFIKYLNKKQGLDTSDDWEEESSVENELSSLLENALQIIKDEISSDDPDRRLKAAIAVMELNHKQFNIE